MSFECLLEACSNIQAEERQEEELAENREVDVPCGGNEPAGNPRHEQVSGGKWLLSPDQSGMQEVISEGGLEQVQREEWQGEEEKPSQMTLNQESCDTESGGCLVKRYQQRSFPRVLLARSNPHRERQLKEPWGSGPLFFFGGTNGAEIVSTYCESRGWTRIYNMNREDVRLKWCETKSATTYFNFREGRQLVFQIPNNTVLTTKIGLVSSLRDYQRVCTKVNHGLRLRRQQMDEFFPTTFRLDVKTEREAFFTQQQEGVSFNKTHMWICKPTHLNQGKGIFLLKSQEDVAAFRMKLQHMEESKESRAIYHRHPQAGIVQHYIQKPLLLNGKKFDVRSFLLIACSAPYIVFFRHGYVRLTCDLYDPCSNKLSTHLTNQYMQKKNPLYSKVKEDTVWSMESFNTYVNDKFQVAKGLSRDWVFGAFAKQMQQIMTHCFLAVKSKLDRRLGFFDLIGCDFLVDEDFKVWLLEMNCNPALHINCKVLKEVIPSTVGETLDLTLEIFKKCCLRQKIFPLASQREFVLLYKGRHHGDPVMADRKTKLITGRKQKNTKNSQKTEPGTCNLVMESQIVPSALPEGYVNVSANSEDNGVSTVSSHHTSNSTTPTHRKPQSVVASRNMNPRLQVPIKPRNCALDYNRKDSNDKDWSKTQQKTKIITLPSSAVVRKRSSRPLRSEPPVSGNRETGPPPVKTRQEGRTLFIKGAP